ncbi:MAG: TolC family protein [Bacteroidetes bacterium]|nr:MAG: TolC family protein [Bacteroidota bacterium]
MMQYPTIMINTHYLFRDGIIWVLLCVFSPLAGMAQQAHQMDLEACIAYALEHNRDLQNARFDVYIAERRAKELLSAGLPQVNLQADVMNNFKLPVFIIPFPDPATGEIRPTESQFGLPWQASAGVSLSQLAFDGTYFIGLKAARESSELWEKDLKRNQEETALAVSKAYYQTLIAREMLRLLEANISRVEELQRETRILHQEGFAEKIDVERLEINLNNLRLELSKAQQGAQLAVDLLKFQMGMPVMEELRLSEEVSEVAIRPAGLEDPAAFAISQRIEYDILQTQKQLETYNLQRYKAGYLPTLYATANYAWNTQWDAGQNFEYYVGAVGLRLSFPIFDGTRKRQQVMQSKLALKKIDNNFVQLENGIRLELKRTRARLQDAYNNIERYRQNLELARKVYKVAGLKYKEGVGSSLELKDAESELKQSESSYLNALLEYLMAKVEYEKARGAFAKYHQ